MMRLAVDSNILAAALIRKGTTRSLFLRADLELFLPDFSLEEVRDHREEYQEKAGLDENEFDILLQTILESFTVVPLKTYAGFEEHAKEISPDVTDWPFFALAPALGCPIWSNEKRLKRQSTVEIYSTTELMRLVMP